MPYADLHKLRIDDARLCALSARERYVFALAGHVFNEVMALQKLLEASKPKAASHELEGNARVGLAILLLKLLAGKVHEAMDYLTRPSVTAVLSRSYFSEVEGLQARWDKSVTHYRSLSWLRDIRNQASFHYMKPGQWKALSNENLLRDGHIIVGPLYAQTFFHWQDVVANYSMMSLVNAEDPFEGLGTMLEDLGELCGDLCECLANGLQHYIWNHLSTPDALGEATPTECPKLESFELFAIYANRP